MRAIEKTSQEEGKYAEYLVYHLMEKAGRNPRDTSDDAAYQKIDVDMLIDNADKTGTLKIEIKNDTRIIDTKRVVYEIRTHVPKLYEECANLMLESDKGYNVKDFDGFGSIGCNEKCEADFIYYVSVEEEIKENRRYRLNYDFPILIINSKKFKEYVNRGKLDKYGSYCVWQPEDKAYNIIKCINKDVLKRAGVLNEVKDDTREYLEKLKPILGTYHTSQELKEELYKIEKRPF